MPALKYFDPVTQAWTNVPACGVAGGAGGTGDLNYRHVQAIPADTWVVVHNLGKYPTIAVADSGGGWVIGGIHYDSLNQCTLSFSAQFSGQAFCN